MKGGPGKDTVWGDRGNDRLHIRDGYPLELAIGGPGYDRCVIDFDSVGSCYRVDHF